MAGWVTVEVKGLAELQRFLSRFPAVLQERLLRQAVSAGAKVIQDEVKRRAPVRQIGTGDQAGKHVGRGKSQLRYPGNLRSHINRQRANKGSGNSVTYSIFPAKYAWYGRLVELGTRTAAAHPFMRPALDARGADAIEKFRATLAAGLDRAVAESK